MAKFELGQVLATPGAIEAVANAGAEMGTLLSRHVNGDWGVVDGDDKRANDRALKVGARLLSAYRLSDGTKVWVITESDRSATTVLLPDEY